MWSVPLIMETIVLDSCLNNACSLRAQLRRATPPMVSQAIADLMISSMRSAAVSASQATVDCFTDTSSRHCCGSYRLIPRAALPTTLLFVCHGNIRTVLDIKFHGMESQYQGTSWSADHGRTNLPSRTNSLNGDIGASAS